MLIECFLERTFIIKSYSDVAQKRNAMQLGKYIHKSKKHFPSSHFVELARQQTNFNLVTLYEYTPTSLVRDGQGPQN